MTRRTIGGVPRMGASLTDEIGRWSRSPASKRKDPPMPKPDLSKARAAAGTRYAKACAELQESMIDLAAIDGLGGGREGPQICGCSPVLIGPLRQLGDLRRHREFQPHPPQGIRAAVEARRAAMGA